MLKSVELSRMKFENKLNVGDCIWIVEEFDKQENPTPNDHEVEERGGIKEKGCGSSAAKYGKYFQKRGSLSTNNQQCNQEEAEGKSDIHVATSFYNNAIPFNIVKDVDYIKMSEMIVVV